jgi:hypothetical protein
MPAADINRVALRLVSGTYCCAIATGAHYVALFSYFFENRAE